MRTRTWAAAAALLAAGCSHAQPAAVTAPQTTTAATACAALFRAGAPAPKPLMFGDTGYMCAVGTGFFVIPGHLCGDRRVLWSASPSTGVPGWGLSGDTWHPTRNVAADPAYGTAYRACVG
jgi:hypothetical protein